MCVFDTSVLMQSLYLLVLGGFGLFLFLFFFLLEGKWILPQMFLLSLLKKL